MASESEPSRGRWRRIAAAVSAVLLFFFEQTVLAQPTDGQLVAADAGAVTVGAGMQWLLALIVLGTSGAFFFAAVRGIRLRTPEPSP